MQPVPSHLPTEMHATTDALGHIILQVSDLVDAQHPAVMNQPATALLLVDGTHVVEALDTLAQRLAAQPGPDGRL